MSSILQPIRINEVYSLNRQQQREEIEKRLSEYESVINPIIVNQTLISSSSSESTPTSNSYSYESTDSSYELLTDQEELVINLEHNDHISDEKFCQAVKDFLDESYDETDEEGEDCAICLEQIQDKLKDDDVYILYEECNHRIHLKCMKKWRKHRELSTNISKMTHLKCELCQVPRKISIIKGLVEVKKSNRLAKMCCIV
ncbi:hypothetical protein N8751_00875 [bacterium]|nr:hypothetical protein [bacterium]